MRAPVGRGACRVGLLGRAVLLIVLVSVAVAGVSAGSVPTAGPTSGSPEALPQVQESEICEQPPETFVDTYNANVEDVPFFVRFIVRNAEVHGVITGDSVGDYSFRTDAEGRVEAFSAGPPDDPSVRITTSCEAFTRMATGGDPVGTFWGEYREGRVEIEGVGLVNWVVIEAAKHFPWILAFAVIGTVGYIGYRRYAILVRRRGEETSEAGLRKK